MVKDGTRMRRFKCAAHMDHASNGLCPKVDQVAVRSRLSQVLPRYLGRV